MRIVADISNYDWPFTTATARCFLDNGISGVIIGCQRPDIARQQCAACRQADLPIIGTYSFMYFGVDTIGQAQAAAAVALEYGVPRVWIDCESEPAHEGPFQTPDKRIAQLHVVRTLVRAQGLRTGIYTAPYWWVPKMGDTREFADDPLWLPNYGTNDPGSPRGPIETTMFGGWTRVAIHQYSSAIVRCGRERDHNYLIDPAVAGEEDDMPDPRVDEILKALTGFDQEAAALQRVAAWNATGNSLLDGFALEQVKLGEHLADHELAGAGLVVEHTHGGIER